MKVRIRRPRVRSSDGEVQLPTLAKLKDIDLFDDRIRERLIQGISTRNYESLISDISGKTCQSQMYRVPLSEQVRKTSMN